MIEDLVETAEEQAIAGFLDLGEGWKELRDAVGADLAEAIVARRTSHIHEPDRVAELAAQLSSLPANGDAELRQLLDAVVELYRDAAKQGYAMLSALV